MHKTQPLLLYYHVRFGFGRSHHADLSRPADVFCCSSSLLPASRTVTAGCAHIKGKKSSKKSPPVRLSWTFFKTIGCSLKNTTNSTSEQSRFPHAECICFVCLRQKVPDVNTRLPGMAVTLSSGKMCGSSAPCTYSGSSSEMNFEGYPILGIPKSRDRLQTSHGTRCSRDSS